MFERSYRKRLAADLARWREQGWVTPEGAAAILASLDNRRPAIGLSVIMALFGAVLLGLGVIAFVAANWEEMPRLLRLGLLLGAMGLAYAIAAGLQKRSFPAFADAGVLVAGLVFAAAIALVGQTYHLSGEFADAVLLWVVGCLGAALLTRSVSATVLTLAGAGYWTWLATLELEIVPHWLGLGPILVGGSIAVLIDSRFARLAFILALAFWIAVALAASAYRFDATYDWAFTLGATLALAFWALGSLLSTFREPRLSALGDELRLPSLIALFGAIGGLQVSLMWIDAAQGTRWLELAAGAAVAAAILAGIAGRRGAFHPLNAVAAAAIGAAIIALTYWHGPDGLWTRLLGGIVALAAVLWVIGMAQADPRQKGKTLGLLAFGAEVFYLYAVSLGTILDTAFAFLLGGLLFIVLSFVLFRVDRWLEGRKQEAAA